MVEGNCIALPYSEIGNLSKYTYGQEARDAIKGMVKEKYYPDAPQTADKKGLGLFRLATVVEEGSLVTVTADGKVLGIGRVTGPYDYEAGTELPHRRPVEWLSLEVWRLPRPIGTETTIVLIRDDTSIVEIEKKFKARLLLIVKPENLHPVSSRAYRRIQSILERKGQVILHVLRPGKTYWAEIAAQGDGRPRCFRKEFAACRMTRTFILGDDHFNGLVRMCTFNPNYGYEDFMEGYKAEKEDSQLVSS